MRKKLKKIDGVRKMFSGTFVRTGIKSNYFGYPVNTILLKNIKDEQTGEILTDHLWFNETQQFKNLNLKPNEVITFEARVTEYEKGYVNERYYIDEREYDYKLAYPTKIRRKIIGGI